MFHFPSGLLITLFLIATQYASNVNADEIPFNQTYYQIWGGNHLTISNEGKEVQLFIDQYSGAGFSSKQNFGSGDFRIKLKLPKKNSKGVITTFYLMSKEVDEPARPKHDEVDFEFFGGDGKYTLNTNIFANDEGHREQQFNLWFDPAADFHTYGILWNQYQIVFFVDDIPIRVFKNNTNHGVNYPSNKMHIEATIWNATAWVGEVDWSQGPFTAYFREFSINGCQYQQSNPQYCYRNSYYWNRINYWKLSPKQQQLYEVVREKQMTYDYCLRNAKDFPEC
ncbi:putative xyloglucan endotransglucosylase/hydrolase protein 1 [Nicotiana sylvestris]|uniref:Xyloglucan endotransglucosylase/hydrolase protein 1 n=1 Tax=Nicotiana sylvestris TaxID=4096 RepID=A0A1U7YUV0_NICSY|nr:PREDICTED: putative xyloglucan endotransglucosylase/hydrolase protein 1 [Nicotiana sylvestris]